jgi:hypothetical protein
METLIVESLSRSAIPTAFPLVHLVTPELDLQAWRRFAISALDRRRGTLAGILVAKHDTHRHLSGLVCYRRELDLVQGRVMQARNLIGIDILDPKPIISALINGVAALARSGDCSKVRILVPDNKIYQSMLPDFMPLSRRHSTMTHCLDILLSTEDLLTQVGAWGEHKG